MNDLAFFKSYLESRFEVAQAYLKQHVEPGTPEDNEQWMIKGRILEIQKLVNKINEVCNESP